MCEREDTADRPTCFGCGAPCLRGNREQHHIIPQELGGKLIVILCKTCHDLVDRVPLGDWPGNLYFRALQVLPREGRLLVLKLLALAFRADAGTVEAVEIRDALVKAIRRSEIGLALWDGTPRSSD